MDWQIFDFFVKGLKAWFEEWEFVQCDFEFGSKGMHVVFGTGTVVAFE